VQFSPQISKAVYAAGNTGLLVAQTGSDAGDSQLLWFDRKLRKSEWRWVSGIHGSISLSPDRKAVATDTNDPVSQNTDIWTHDLEKPSRPAPHV
jgi:hypothetical protein